MRRLEGIVTRRLFLEARSRVAETLGLWITLIVYSMCLLQKELITFSSVNPTSERVQNERRTPCKLSGMIMAEL